MALQGSPGWRAWLTLAAALVLLNASLTFENVWPTPRIAWGHALSLELALCVLLLAVAHRWATGLARRILPALWVVLVAGHYLDVTAPGLYGREFNLYWDSQHLGNVAAMLAAAAPWWLIAAVAATVVLAVGLVYALARLAIGQLAVAVEHRRPRLALGALAGVVVLLFAGQRVAGFPIDVAFADPVTPAYLRQARFALAMVGPGAAAPRLGPSPALDTGLRALGGVDVLLFFVESYGAITYETPAISAGLTESRADLDAAIRETGRQVVSAYVESPTFGGSSWLAHLSLLSGVDVRDQYAYTSLMASQRDTLVTNFARRGYHTVALMPGMRQAWPEGALLRLRRDLRAGSPRVRGAAVRMVGHSGSVRARAARRARTAPGATQPGIRRLSNQHDARALRSRAAVSAGVVARPDHGRLRPRRCRARHGHQPRPVEPRAELRARHGLRVPIAGGLPARAGGRPGPRRDRRPSAACRRERQGRVVARPRARDRPPGTRPSPAARAWIPSGPRTAAPRDWRDVPTHAAAARRLR